MAFENVKVRSLRNGINVVDGAREDLVALDVVTVSLTDTTGVTSFLWEIVGRPEYSAAGGGGTNPWFLGNGPSASFTVDADAGAVHIDGTYIVQCTVNINTPTETRISTELARPTSITIPGLPPGPARKLRKLGMFESLQDTISIANVLAGWSTMMNRWLDVILGIALAPPTFPGYGIITDITQIDIGDAASAGALLTVSRADHQHPNPAPTIIKDVAAVLAIGTSARMAREDHEHRGVRTVNGLFGDVVIPAFGGFGSNIQSVFSSNQPGISGLAAREDHKHMGVAAINGLVGSLILVGPLVEDLGGGFINIENSKTTTLTFPAPLIDTDAFNGFIIGALTANQTIPVPSTRRSGRKITFAITQGSPARTITWSSSSQGFKFATAIGISQSQFDSLLAATPNNGVILVGWEFHTVLNFWVCTALAGYFQ